MGTLQCVCVIMGMIGWEQKLMMPEKKANLRSEIIED